MHSFLYCFIHLQSLSDEFQLKDDVFNGVDTLVFCAGDLITNEVSTSKNILVVYDLVWNKI